MNSQRISQFTGPNTLLFMSHTRYMMSRDVKIHDTYETKAPYEIRNGHKYTHASQDMDINYIDK